MLNVTIALKQNEMLVMLMLISLNTIDVPSQSTEETFDSKLWQDNSRCNTRFLVRGLMRQFCSVES